MMMGGGSNAQQRASIATTIDSSATGPTQHGGGSGSHEFGYNASAYSIGIGDHHPRHNNHHHQQQQHRAYRLNRTSSDSENEGRGGVGARIDGQYEDDDEDQGGDGDVDDDYGQRRYAAADNIGGGAGADIDSNNDVFARGALSGYHTFRPGPRYGGAFGGGGSGGNWGAVRPTTTSGGGAASRAVSPIIGGGGSGGIGLAHMDDMSEHSSSQVPMAAPMVRSKSRTDLLAGGGSSGGAMGPGPTSSRYGNLSYWKARRVLFYRNGDPFFPGVEFRFKPFRDIASLEALLDKISPKMDLPRGARYVFSMDGDRKYNLDELEDGASYVLSSFKGFKVSVRIAFCMCLFGV